MEKSGFQKESYNFYNSKGIDISIQLTKNSLDIKKKKYTSIDKEHIIGCRFYNSENELNQPKLELIYVLDLIKKNKKSDKEFIYIELYHQEKQYLYRFREKLMEILYQDTLY